MRYHSSIRTEFCLLDILTLKYVSLIRNFEIVEDIVYAVAFYIFFLRQLQEVTRDRNNHDGDDDVGDRERQ